MNLSVNHSLHYEEIIIRVLHLLSEMSWSDITYKFLSNDLGTRPLIIYQSFKNKTEILKGIIDFADQKMKDLYNIQNQNQLDLTHEENLFEIIVCRLEALTPYKKAFFHLTEIVWRHPLEACEISPYFFNSLKSLLHLSKINISGFKGVLITQVFSYTYLQIIYQWFRDTTPDQSLTLIAVENNLKNFMKILTKF